MIDTTVLVIHSEFAFRRAFRDTLENLGYPVLHTAVGSEGINIARDGRCSVAVIGSCIEDAEDTVDSIIAVSPRTKCIMLGSDGTNGRSVRYLSGHTIDLNDILEEVGKAHAEYETTATLRESDEKYKNLFSAVPEAVCIAEVTSRTLIDANDSFFELYGMRSRDLRTSKYDAICNSPADEIPRLFTEATSERGAGFTSDHVKSDGTVFPVSISSRRFSLGTSELLCVVIHDNTEQDAIEAELKDANRSAQAIMEGIGECFIAIHANQNIIYCNRAAALRFGAPGEDPVGTPLFEAYPELAQTSLESWIREIHSVPRPLSFEQYFDSDEGRKWFDIKLSPYDSKVAIFLRDITESKEMEMRLQQTQRLESIGRLAGGIAHDFNNLLTVIIGYTDLMNDDPELSEETVESVEEIRKSAERASELTHQLLAFSRKQVLQPRLLAANDLVRSSESMLRRLIGEDIDLELILESQTGKIEVDPIQLEQVILNLALNARDAMPGGGKLTIATSNVEISADEVEQASTVRAGSYVEISVIDTGCGIEKEALDRIFEPFFSTKSRDQGSGLGLSTAYGIIRQSHGYLIPESTIGVGSKFKLYLPICVEATVSDLASDLSDRKGDVSGTILVVEDDPSLRTITTRVLSNIGYTVMDACDGNEALEIVMSRGSTEMDLIIADVVLPGRSGREVVEMIRKHQNRAKVLYISGYAGDDMLKHGVNAGREAFLAKPFSSDMLKRKVQTLLAES